LDFDQIAVLAPQTGCTKVTPKRPRDPNQLAKSIVDIATGEKPDRDPTPEEQGKDPAAVAMGGKVWAAGMTAKRRKEIAKKAAVTRWDKKTK
jgi:hypothetical protein